MFLLKAPTKKKLQSLQKSNLCGQHQNPFKSLLWLCFKIMFSKSFLSLVIYIWDPFLLSPLLQLHLMRYSDTQSRHKDNHRALAGRLGTRRDLGAHLGTQKLKKLDHIEHWDTLGLSDIWALQAPHFEYSYMTCILKWLVTCENYCIMLENTLSFMYSVKAGTSYIVWKSMYLRLLKAILSYYTTLLVYGIDVAVYICLFSPFSHTHTHTQTHTHCVK